MANPRGMAHCTLMLWYRVLMEIEFEERLQSLCIATCAQDGNAARELFEKYEAAIRELRGSRASSEAESETPTVEQLREMMG